MMNIITSFNKSDWILIGTVVVFLVLLFVIYFVNQLKMGNLNIKAKTVGDGQYGNARFITAKEKEKAYKKVKFQPQYWRQGKKLPASDLSGVIVAVKPPFMFKNKAKYKPNVHNPFTCYIETADVHTGVYAGAGSGKTAFFLYPNLEFACSTGMSFVTTDTKGDLYRNYGYIAKEYYGYNVCVLDLRNPTESNGNNILAPVNKYMDMYMASGGKDISSKAKAEKYAKLIAENIIVADGGDGNYGANSYFYDSAKGLLTATILLVSEFGEDNERHIPSVFTLLTELLEINVEIKNKQPIKELRYSKLIKNLPVEHRARLFATAAVTGSDSTTLSVLTTALSKLNSFIDSEIEQLLCFENDIDIESFCKHKTALFIVLPEEDTTKYFLVSLLLQQFYRECLIYADSLGGKMPRRIMFYLDEIGTIPKIQGLDMMFSASRSRDIFIVPIMQAPSQMEDKYGEHAAETINSNIACMLYSGFAPENSLAKKVSEALGNVTVMAGSYSTNGSFEGNTATRQMTAKPLISANELQELPQGSFVVRRTGQHPMLSQLYLFLRMGITFPEKYTLRDKGLREVSYLSADVLEQRLFDKYVNTEDSAPAHPSRNGGIEQHRQDNKKQEQQPEVSEYPNETEQTIPQNEEVHASSDDSEQGTAAFKAGTKFNRK